MSANSTANRGRAAALRLMTDTCRIYRPGSGSVIDENTGLYSDTDTTLYTGVCRVKQVPGTRTGGELVGETVVGRWAPIVSVPVTVTNVQPGDRIIITASQDDAVEGRVYLIQGVHAGTHATARRLVCEALS